eukprot:5622353-Alexandrium_andersonii.AAC.1
MALGLRGARSRIARAATRWVFPQKRKTGLSPSSPPTATACTCARRAVCQSLRMCASTLLLHRVTR